MLGSQMIDVQTLARFCVEAFESLRAQTAIDGGPMPALWIPGRPDAMFAMSSNGDFYLLVRAGAAPQTPFERKLDALRVSLGGQYRLSELIGGSEIESRFAAVMLDHAHPDLLTAFGNLAAILLASLAANPTSEDLTVFVNDFLKLFAPQQSVARQTVVGLWGELWLIRESGAADRMVDAWHIDATDRYDFSFESLRIEAKTTEGAVRRHTFAMAQLEEQPKPTWIASLTVVSDAAGESVGDLLSALLLVVSPEKRPSFVQKCLESISGDLEAIEDFRFAPSGTAALALIPARSIPRVDVPIGSGITDVRFRVDISGLARGSDVALADLLA
jgi:hypothetical protein